MRLLTRWSCLFLCWILSIASGSKNDADFFSLREKLSIPGSSGIKTDKNYTPERLVREVFIKGTCDNVSNISGIGNPDGIGYFENGMDVIGLEKGIILASGPISGAEGPNAETRQSGNFGDSRGDRDLRALAGGQVYDAVGIEFDFVPLDPFVTFRYVFASEEYCEFVGSAYNDVFGFFISGPGISGGFSNGSTNVALVPGSNDYVSINTINHQRNKDFYVSNIRADDARECGLVYTGTPLANSIEYDGFTKGLVAFLNLIPCETYHIRFVVSDVGDNFYDSAVFLEAGSFNLGGEVTINSVVAENPEKRIFREGCDSLYFNFERANLNTLDFPLSVKIKLSDSNTAVEGEDFSPIPRSVTIPAGAAATRLGVALINDLTIEQTETLGIELDIPCACYSGISSVELVDPPALSVTLDDVDICEDTSTRLEAKVSGGTADFSYRWSTGERLADIRVAPDSLSFYTVRVTDACGNVAADTAQVRVLPPPEAFIEGELEICQGDEALFPVYFTGEAPWAFSYARNNSTAGKIENITENPFYLKAQESGVYRITRFEDRVCEGAASGVARLQQTTIRAVLQVTDVSCHGDLSGEIKVNPSGGLNPYSYSWSSGATSRDLKNIPAGDYELNITDAKGCVQAFPVRVKQPEPLGNATFSCSDMQRGLINIQATGGSPPYRYSANGSPSSDNSIFERLIPGENYDLQITDNKGCQLQQDFVMPAPVAAMSRLPEEMQARLGVPLVLDPDYQVPENLIESAEWFPERYLDCYDCLYPKMVPIDNVLYVLRLKDIFGCVNETSTFVLVNRRVEVFVPNAFSPDGDGYNDQLTLFADPAQVKQILHLTIFSRWGDQVFQRRDFPPNDERFSWDGRFQGKPLPTGMYVYSAQVQLVDDTVVPLQGEILLMK